MLYNGQDNTLKILRHTSVGLYLGDGEGNEILLPNKYVPDEASIGDEIRVFIYKDSEERLIATTLEPLIRLNEFAWLRVNDVNAHGAFLYWGLEKDLFVPFKEQHERMVKGRNYIVYMYLDEGTERLTASSRIYKFLNLEKPVFENDEEVDLLVYGRSEMGYKVIINNKFEGLIYHNEIFQEITTGDRLKGYIKMVRPDDKIDVRLQQSGYHNIEPSSEFILLYLKAHQGFLPLTDKSDPEQIVQRLDMSKKTFKKAIGNLYKQRLIRLEHDGIYLV